MSGFKSLSLLVRFQISTVLLMMVISLNSYSQRAPGEQVLTAGIGVSYLNFVIGVSSISSNDVSTSSIPTLNFMYDYGITENFSLGAAVGYNSFSITEETQPNYGYPTVYYKSETDVNRTNIALRPLFHWGKRAEMDMFAGARLGYSIWKASFSSTDPLESSDYQTENLYSIQILFGGRAYFTDKLGVTFDIGIGTPYFASLGLSLKL